MGTTRREGVIAPSETTRRLSCAGKENSMIINPDWLAGFVDGEGTFYVGIYPNKEMKTGYQVLPEFRIVQHKRDIKLLYAIKKYFDFGVVRRNHDERYEYRVRDIRQIQDVIIPFFRKHTLNTQKKFDFVKFATIVRLMSEKEHLSKNGIVKIIDIASKMNRKDKVKALQIKNKLKSTG